MTTKLQPFNLNTAATFSFTGNTSFSGANVSLGSVSSLRITGGSANNVLKTDGSGNLSWVEQSAGGGGGSGDVTTAKAIILNLVFR